MMEENAKQEILDAISLLAEQMQGLANEFHDNKKKTEAGFTAVKSEIGSMRFEIGGMKSEISSMKSEIVTKSYLDDKLADLRGDLVALTKKSNVKLSVLVESLVKDGSLKQNTAKLILAMEPFASS
ncbi:MAG: hypothetical protein ABIB04_01575 [Patescibacteria group bacterium]